MREVYEPILLEAYRVLVDIINETETRKNNIKDKKLATALLSKLCISLINIDEDESVSEHELRRYLIEAKTVFVQLCYIRARNPEIITNIFNVRLEQLMKAMARREAGLLDEMINDNPDAGLLDVKKVFRVKKNIKLLKSKLASDICENVVKEFLATKNVVYITKTGGKYHKKSCPYCKGRELVAKAKDEVEKLQLLPCKCMIEVKIDKDTVTAFIDESIHPVRWNERGRDGKVGSFSFILCWGDLKSEREITDANTIVKQVDYFREDTKVERVTESAIGKVMVSLAYDYEFHGNLKIFVDNLAAAEHWSDNPKNSKLADLFQNVTVTHIKREKNKRTDKLLKDTIFLCIPKETYRSLVKKCEM